MRTGNERASLYAEVTARVIAELEAGRLPWVQPWDAASCGCAMPANAVTGRRYSGINVLILWAAVIEGGYKRGEPRCYRSAQAAARSRQRATGPSH
jgi:antirestriction protein ArdC